MLVRYCLSGMIRTGIGFDAHRFAEGRRLILGGVRILHTQGLLGHSDADVLCHAVSDALLGSLALGDIGQHFPDSDPQWKDADSIQLLRQCSALAAAENARVVNVDATVIAERPKLAPYIDSMRENIAAAMSVPAHCVSVKATTVEQMGALGRGEGVAAMAVVTVDVGE